MHRPTLAKRYHVYEFARFDQPRTSRPFGSPAPGPNSPVVKNAGHFLPYHGFVPDLYKDPNGTISYAPASSRRNRTFPHDLLTNPYSAPSLQRGDLIWISAPAQVNIMLIGTPVFVVENLHDVNIAGYGVVEHGWLCTLCPTSVMDRPITHEELVVIGRQEIFHPTNLQTCRIPDHQAAFYQDYLERLEYPCHHNFPHVHIHPDHPGCSHCLYNYFLLSRIGVLQPTYTRAGNFTLPDITSYSDPPESLNPHVVNHTTDPKQQPTPPPDATTSVYDMTDSRSLRVRGGPPTGLQTGLEPPAKAAGVNRWGAPTAAPASPDTKPRTKPPPPLATVKATPQPRTKPPPPVQTPPFFHFHTRPSP